MGGTPEKIYMTVPEVVWQGIAQYMRGSDALTEWFSDEFTKELIIQEENFMKQVLNAFSYVGFDPRRIVQVMMASKEAYDMRVTQSTDYIIKFGSPASTSQLVWTNKKKHIDDFRLMIYIFGVRGSTWVKITENSADGVGPLMEMFKEKYNLDTSVHEMNKALAPDTVTLPRLAGCFPVILCDFYHKGHGKALVNLEAIGVPTTVSKMVGTPYFTSYIPEEWVKGEPNPHLFFFLVHIKVDDLINKKKTDRTSLTDMLKYYQAAWFSPAVPTHTRAPYCVARNLGNQQGDGFVASLAGAFTEAETRIRASRPEDEFLGTVITNLKNLKSIGVPVAAN